MGRKLIEGSGDGHAYVVGKRGKRRAYSCEWRGNYTSDAVLGLKGKAGAFLPGNHCGQWRKKKERRGRGTSTREWRRTTRSSGSSKKW